MRCNFPHVCSESKLSSVISEPYTSYIIFTYWYKLFSLFSRRDFLFVAVVFQPALYRICLQSTSLPLKRALEVSQATTVTTSPLNESYSCRSCRTPALLLLLKSLSPNPYFTTTALRKEFERNVRNARVSCPRDKPFCNDNKEAIGRERNCNFDDVRSLKNVSRVKIQVTNLRE